MKALRLAPVVALILGVSAVPAHADGFVSPFLGFNFGGDAANCLSISNCEEKRANWGVALGTTNGIFGVEEEIGYSPSFFGKTTTSDNAVLTVMTNLMVLLPAGPVQPYGIIGLGLVRPHVTFDATSLALSKNTFGYDIGGGLTIFPTHGFGVRGDVRHIRTFKGVTLGVFSTDQLDFWRASGALVFRF